MSYLLAKRSWRDALREKVIPLRYCGEYVVCPNHPAGVCNFEIVPESEWKSDIHAGDILEYLHKSPEWKVHGITPVLVAVHEERKRSLRRRQRKNERSKRA